MGIRGLYSYFALNLRAYAILDLIQKSKVTRNMEILIDFRSFHKDIDEIIMRKLTFDFDNEYLTIFCSEYDIFCQAYLEFHKIFAEIGIKLIWIFDGIKGLDEVVRNQKYETWTSRLDNYSNLVDGVLECCKNKTPVKDLQKTVPMYDYLAIIEILKNNGAEVIKLLQGGSDEFIASEFHRRKSYAILTNDTDFLVFKDCRVIFFRNLLELHHDNLPFIDNENPGRFFKKPEKFACPIVTQNEVFGRLQLYTHEEIIMLSILKGNDNTYNYSQNLLYALGVAESLDRWPHITRVANFIKSRKITRNNLFDMEGMNTFLRGNPEFRKTVDFCFDFYTFRHYEAASGKTLIHFDPFTADNSLTSFFQKKLSNIEIFDQLYGSHFGKFSSGFWVEKSIDAFSTITTLMREIRSRIYPYVLKTDLESVTEHNYRDSPEPIVINVDHSLKSNLIIGKPDSISERQIDVKYGIDIFENIWSHLEDRDSLNFFELFGLEKGFLCYILRYFYKLTSDINICVTVKEFEALFGMVFYKYRFSKNIPLKTKLNQDILLGMKICPSERCMTIFSWFMDVYMTGKYFCGGALNFQSDLPSFQNVFSSCVFIAFYETNMNESHQRADHLDGSVIEMIEDLEKKILESFNDEYKAITE